MVAENNQVQGVLTRKELIKGLSEYGNTSPVSHVMRKDFVIVTPDMPLQQVYEKLMTNNAQLAPVLEGEQLIGIVDATGINEMVAITKGIKR